MTVIVEVFAAFGLAVSENKAEKMLMQGLEKALKPGETTPSALPELVIAAAGQNYAQVSKFRYLGGLVTEDRELTPEINRRSQATWDCLKKFSLEPFDPPLASRRLKIRLLNAEAWEALLYGYMTWAPCRDHYALLGQHTTGSSLESSATAGNEASTDRYRTIKHSRRRSGNVWRPLSD